MSKWRNRALELFPEFRVEIDEADSINALWIELTSKFQDLYADQGERHSPNTVRAIYLYAIWCLNSDSPDAREAVTTGFLESFAYLSTSISRAMYPKLIQDIVKNVGTNKLRTISGAFAYVLRPDQLKQLFKDCEQAEARLSREGTSKSKT